LIIAEIGGNKPGTSYVYMGEGADVCARNDRTVR
jgi:hypothetical protein